MIIEVDRLQRVEYPPFVRQLLHPELDASGPSSYPLSSVELWHHPLQKSQGVPSRDIYAYLTRTGLIERCLRVADGRAIEKLGVDVFRQYFEFNALYFWASAVNTESGTYIPFFDVRGGAAAEQAKFGWQWATIEFDCYALNPAAMFSKEVRW